MKKDEENEITEMWRELKRERQEKRASNRENGAAQLITLGIPFESKNDGAHLIVKLPNAIFDYWPGTGKYCERHGQYKRGIRNLLRDIANA